MTKLMEWITVLIGLLAVYIALITNKFQIAFIDKWMFEIVISPIIFIGLFGIYSVVTILYRVVTFNDCTEAAEELQQQIKEARADLETKGFKFVN